MDFGDILRIFGIIILPIIFKTYNESRKKRKEHNSTYQKNTGNINKPYEDKKVSTQTDYRVPQEVTKPNYEVKPQYYNDEDYVDSRTSLESYGYNEEDYIKQRPSLESYGYNEEDHIKQRSSLESSEYNIREEEIYQTTEEAKKHKTYDVIRDSEIGSERIKIKFDRSELVKGIVMSEILSKPKSLRK